MPILALTKTWQERKKMEPIKEIHFDRVYDAPLDVVWQAWTDPHRLMQWWGPKGVSIPECEVDLRVGGTIYIVMEADETMGAYQGTKWPMRGEFTRIEPKTHLAYHAQAWTEGQEEETKIDQTTELTLSEEDGKTKLHIKAAIHTVGPGATMAVQGMEYGFTQQLDKLASFLSEQK